MVAAILLTVIWSAAAGVVVCVAVAWRNRPRHDLEFDHTHRRAMHALDPTARR